MYACTGRIVFVFGKIEKAVRRRRVIVVVVVIDCGIATADGMHRCFAIIFYIALFYTILFAALIWGCSKSCRRVAAVDLVCLQAVG